MESALRTAEAVWTFLILITTTAPLGFWSFVVAAIFPAVFLPWARRSLPVSFYPHSRDFISETIALVGAILLAWLPWQTLQGALIGIMAGFMSPWLTKGALAIAGVLFRTWRRLLGDTDKTQQGSDP